MIFEDRTGKRWIIIKTFFLSGLLFVLGMLILYALHSYGVIFLPFISDLLSFVIATGKKVLIAYLLIAIAIGFLRMGFLIFYGIRQVRRDRILREYEKVNRYLIRIYQPDVTVLIPVFNEEVVIHRTVRAILASDYPITEILVIDDGSTDATADIVKREFRHERIVELIQKRNGGKASALNMGFQLASGDIIITIDADTIFQPETVSNLVRNFSDSRVAAVSGNCKIGNIRNQLTLWQHIEYVTANNLEKRAFEELNCITVVPGSNSAWRRRVVKQVGYFHHDTLAEDTELTLRLLNEGYKIIYDDRAISYEECPETVKDFIKQRYRWSYGILQTAWKHKRNILTSSNKSLKYFAVPSMLFSYLLYLTSPLIDFIFLAAFLSGTTSIYFYALLFYTTDVLNSVIAFKLGGEKMKPLVWVIFQRMGYRYLIAYVTWKTIIMALRGTSVGWNKLKRSGNNTYS
ncbi:glycosyltransferase [Sporosarcina sp. 179-K 3D1 HS]|uniref:glycosyltransferase n=1 Tax=Sporosarcina sp. 179-K 3D1 HS TaxID=3232169 RepID=UPI00399FCE42